jgi:oxygen-independent coproporphyrinogen-3 oxidase
MGQDFSPPPLSLYIHIPFCLSRCGYCSFFSLRFSKSAIEAYLGYLNKEKALYRQHLSSPLASLYFGGGSPSLLSAEQINTVCEGLQLSPYTEITLEINPIQITPAFLSALTTTPVNRLSLGVQSMTDAELKWLDRRHTAAQMPDKLKLCREFGYDNISLDLIYGLPGSSVATLSHNLDAYLALEPEHVSCYLLTLDEESVRYAEVGTLPDEDSQFEQYELIRSTLTANGFQHYEISNFALPDKASRHNLAYWNSNNYLALGASAAGWMAPIRYHNAADLTDYYRSIDTGEIYPNQSVCTRQRMMEDYLMMGLRLIEGIDVRGFKQRFGMDIDAVYRERIRQLTSIGMLKREDDSLSLSEAALFVSNRVIAELIL